MKRFTAKAAGVEEIPIPDPLNWIEEADARLVVHVDWAVAVGVKLHYTIHTILPSAGVARDVAAVRHQCKAAHLLDCYCVERFLSLEHHWPE